MAITYNFIDIAKNNPENQVILNYGSGSFKFYLSDDVSFSLGNSWSSPLEGSIGQKLGLDGAIANAVKQGFAEIFNKDLTFKHVRETIKFYQGSEALDLSFKGYLIASKETDNLLTDLQTLYDMAGAEFDGKDDNLDLNFSLKAPLGYAPNLKGNTGKISVQIGTWFRSTQVYLLSKARPEISNAKLPNKTPAYIGLTIDLTPFRMLSAGEIKKFFIS